MGLEKHALNVCRFTVCGRMRPEPKQGTVESEMDCEDHSMIINCHHELLFSIIINQTITHIIMIIMNYYDCNYEQLFTVNFYHHA